MTRDSPTIGTSARSGARTFGDAFDPRNNSLNLLRLVLAVTVVASHAVGLGLFGRDWIGDKTTYGELAVFGFFGISGFLIARSAEANNTVRYLWQRFIRIFPAFWVCLIVTAFGIAYVTWLKRNAVWHLHPPSSAYFHASDSPVGYVTHNWLLKLGQPTIVSTLWNSSIWTLFYEFLCYLMLGGLALAGVLRRRLVVVALFVVLWCIDAACTAHPAWQSTTESGWWHTPKVFVELAVVFLAGTLLHLYRDQIRDSGWIALACVAAIVASMWLPIGGPTPAFTLTSTALVSPLIAYPVLWLGFHLPFTSVGSTNDYSYGIYIYAYPVGLLIGPFGAASHGYLVFFALNLLCTVPLAVASWWLIERQALKLKRWSPTRRRSPTATGGEQLAFDPRASATNGSGAPLSNAEGR